MIDENVLKGILERLIDHEPDVVAPNEAARQPAEAASFNSIMEDEREHGNAAKALSAGNRRSNQSAPSALQPAEAPSPVRAEISEDRAVEDMAKAIAGERWERIERPAGNTQSKEEYAYYLRTRWTGEATAAFRALQSIANISPKGEPVRAEWMPIDTAPKDGTEILVCDDQGIIVKAHWYEPTGDWIWWEAQDGRYVTTVEAYKWMPLPNPPTITEKE